VATWLISRMRSGDAGDGLDAGRGRLPDAGDLGAELVGHPGRLRGEALHLRRDDREAPFHLAGAGRLEGGVEREQIGLTGDVRDQAYHVADSGGDERKVAVCFGSAVDGD